jgi:hypothetical protein
MYEFEEDALRISIWWYRVILPEVVLRHNSDLEKSSWNSESSITCEQDLRIVLGNKEIRLNLVNLEEVPSQFPLPRRKVLCTRASIDALVMFCNPKPNVMLSREYKDNKISQLSPVV